MPSLVAHTHEFNYEMLLNGIKKWPEHMTMSPSSCHLGIYKSLQCHTISEEDRKKHLQEHPLDMIVQGCDVLYLIFDIMSLTLKHTYALKRWRVVWTMFIEKE